MAHIYQINSCGTEIWKGSDIVCNNVNMREWSSINIYEFRTIRFTAANMQ